MAEDEQKNPFEEFVDAAGNVITDLSEIVVSGATLALAGARTVTAPLAEAAKCAADTIKETVDEAVDKNKNKDDGNTPSA